MNKRLTPFKWCMLQSFPFIEATFDAIDNYQLLCKIVEYVNENIDKTNELGIKVEELNNWFNNLDVQDEINNKLDEMVNDGTLQNIINNDLLESLNQNIINNTNSILSLQLKQNDITSNINNINNINIEQNMDINLLKQKQVNNIQKNENNSISMNMLNQEVRESLTGGSTAVVGINSIGTKQLINKSITVYKLDDNLLDSFTLNYKQLEKPTNRFQGFYQIQGGVIRYFNTDTNLQCYIMNLEKGKTYKFSGYNYSSVKGILIGTDLENPAVAFSENGNPLNKEGTVIVADTYSSDLIFECNEDNLKAFITEFSNITNVSYPSIQNKAGGLFELTSVDLFNKELPRNSLQIISPYTVIENYILQIPTNPYALRSVENYRIKCYEFKKGHKYKITGTQQFLIAGFILFDNQFYNIYSSATESNPDKVSYEYEFVSQNDYYGCTIEGGGLSSIVYEYVINIENSTNRIINKKIIYNGDSITESRTNENSPSYNGGAYPKLISNITESSFVNYATGGGTLASKEGGYRIVNNIVNMDEDADIIIFSGGINDYWQNIPLGTFNPSDYNSNVDITTVSGALEKIFRDSINKWIGKPILFVITHKIYNTVYNNNNSGYSFKDLHDRIVEICNKYSIPYYDCYKDGGLNSYLPIMNTTFMTAGSTGQPDYTHPNESAYLKYYVPQIIDLINKNLPY